MNRQSWCQEDSSPYAILPSRSPYHGLLLQVPGLQEGGRRLLDRMFHRKSALLSPSLPPWPGLVILQGPELQGGRRLLGRMFHKNSALVSPSFASLATLFTSFNNTESWPWGTALFSSFLPVWPQGQHPAVFPLQFTSPQAGPWQTRLQAGQEAREMFYNYG